MSLSKAIATASDPATVMDRVLGEVLVLVPGADGAAALCALGDTLVYVASAGTLADACGTEVLRAGSLSGLAIESGTIQHCRDTESDLRVDRITCRALHIASMICVPLSRCGERIGVFMVASRQVDAFGPEDEVSLTGLTRFVSTVIGAAVELASVTAELLDGSDDERTGAHPGALGDVGPATQARATFVANVVSPGIALQAEVSTRIEEVLSGKGLTTVFQPIVALHDGSIVVVEALSRFTGPPLKGPDHWFAEAASVGRGQALELWAIKKALGALDRIPRPISMAINAGPDTFCSPELLSLVEAAGPERVVVELTEHTDIDDYPRLHRACSDLRSRGARVAIDDTGSGFAGLSLLLEVAPEITKLDRQLTTGIDADPVRRALAGSLVTFAAETGSAVVAEGIETAGELQTLTDLGIQYGQGFYLARPSCLEELRPFLDHRCLAISA